jgi:hypothetical protein
LARAQNAVSIETLDSTHMPLRQITRDVALSLDLMMQISEPSRDDLRAAFS